MSNRKGKKGTPQGEQETDTAKLISAAEALLSEPASDFLPPQQKVEFLRKNLDKAMRKLERAIELDASLSAAHHLLGVVCERTGRKPAAAQSFVRAAELAAGSDADPSTRDAAWAESAARAFGLLLASSSSAAETPLPDWWTDAALLALSERAVQLLPESAAAHRWRAACLSGFRTPSLAKAPQAPEAAAERSAVQLRAAATHFSKAAAQMVGAPGAEEEQRDALVQAGAACLRDAMQLERLQAGGGGGGDNEADGEAARAAREAEAKAAKNRKKKLAKRSKAGAEGAAADDDEGNGGGSGPSGAGGSSAADAVVESPAAALAAAAAVSAAAAAPPRPPPLAGYRWATSLPAGYRELLGSMGILPGGPVSEVDLKGVVAEGGAAVAVAVGLLEPFEEAAEAPEEAPVEAQ